MEIYANGHQPGFIKYNPERRHRIYHELSLVPSLCMCEVINNAGQHYSRSATVYSNSGYVSPAQISHSSEIPFYSKSP